MIECRTVEESGMFIPQKAKVYKLRRAKLDHAQIAVACKLRWPKYTVSIHLLASAMPGGVVLPHRKLMGMCRWMGSHFHDWIDYNGLHFQ